MAKFWDFAGAIDDWVYARFWKLYDKTLSIASDRTIDLVLIGGVLFTLIANFVASWSSGVLHIVWAIFCLILINCNRPVAINTHDRLLVAVRFVLICVWILTIAFMFFSANWIELLRDTTSLIVVYMVLTLPTADVVSKLPMAPSPDPNLSTGMDPNLSTSPDPNIFPVVNPELLTDIYPRVDPNSIQVPPSDSVNRNPPLPLDGQQAGIGNKPERM